MRCGRISALTKDPDLAEDISQIALLKCWQFWRDKDPETLTKLALTVGRNQYFTERKRRQLSMKVLIHRKVRVQTQSAEARFEDSELVARVGEAARKLPAHYQEVLQRIFFLDQTYDEAAYGMGKSRNTIKTWRRRILVCLRADLNRTVKNDS